MGIELGPIIEEAELALFTENHQSQCACDRWPNDCVTFPGGVKSVTFSVNAESIITAAAPLIERAVLKKAAAELLAWAETKDPTSALRRHIGMCARRVEPEPTEDEIREALGELLGGMRGRICHLDDAGRAVRPPSTRCPRCQLLPIGHEGECEP